MSKHIHTDKLTPTLRLSECTDGFWLYDTTRGMNLSMRAKTPQDAFVECITYYQKRLSHVETAHRDLSAKVNNFVEQFTTEDNAF